jgi:tetratricopeptide (TPR) repeat protein
MRDPYAWERLTNYEEALVEGRLRAIGRRPRGRVRLDGDPLPDETESASHREPTAAEQLARAHASFAERDFLLARLLARAYAGGVVRSASSSPAQRADALRVRAMAADRLGHWDDAIEEAEQALELEPDGKSVEVWSSELRDVLIPLWRSWL